MRIGWVVLFEPYEFLVQPKLRQVVQRHKSSGIMLLSNREKIKHKGLFKHIKHIRAHKRREAYVSLFALCV